MIEVVHRKRRHKVPECWDECHPRQFLAIIKALSAPTEGLRRRVELLKAILGMPSWRYWMLSAEQVTRLLELTEWITSDETITRQMVPSIHAGTTLYGPAGGFTNLTAGEFHFADMFYSAWKMNGDLVDLYRYLAVLYRPGKKGYNVLRNEDGDRRQPFNPNLIDYYAAKLQRLGKDGAPTEMAIAACFCYDSWRMQLEQEHRRLFTRKTKARAARFGWLPVLRGVAKAGQYGTLDQVERMPFGNLMIELEMLLDEEAELKAKHPQLFKNQQ